MAETRSRSIRVADDVWEAIQALPGKTDDALRAILVTKAAPKVDNHAEVNRWFRETWTRLDEILEMLQSTDSFIPNVGAAYVMPSPARTDPASIPGVSQGLPPKRSAIIKRFRCEHCGTSPAVPRMGDVCESCQEGGHRDDVRRCPEC